MILAAKKIAGAELGCSMSRSLACSQAASVSFAARSRSTSINWFEKEESLEEGVDFAVESDDCLSPTVGELSDAAWGFPDTSSVEVASPSLSGFGEQPLRLTNVATKKRHAETVRNMEEEHSSLRAYRAKLDRNRITLASQWKGQVLTDQPPLSVESLKRI